MSEEIDPALKKSIEIVEKRTERILIFFPFFDCPFCEGGFLGITETNFLTKFRSVLHIYNKHVLNRR